jgi:hypothetical protein
MADRVVDSTDFSAIVTEAQKELDPPTDTDEETEVTTSTGDTETPPAPKEVDPESEVPKPEGEEAGATADEGDTADGDAEPEDPFAHIKDEDLSPVELATIKRLQAVLTKNRQKDRDEVTDAKAKADSEVTEAQAETDRLKARIEELERRGQQPETKPVESSPDDDLATEYKRLNLGEPIAEEDIVTQGDFARYNRQRDVRHQMEISEAKRGTELAILQSEARSLEFTAPEAAEHSKEIIAEVARQRSAGESPSVLAAWRTVKANIPEPKSDEESIDPQAAFELGRRQGMAEATKGKIAVPASGNGSGSGTPLEKGASIDDIFSAAKADLTSGSRE